MKSSGFDTIPSRRLEITKWEAATLSNFADICLKRGFGMGMCEGRCNGMQMSVPNLIRKLDKFVGEEIYDHENSLKSLSHSIKRKRKG